jgi:hypothetical protein
LLKTTKNSQLTDKVNWPRIRNLFDNLELLSNYEKRTSTVNLKRMTCSVCGRADELNINEIHQHLFPVPYLNLYKNLLRNIENNENSTMKDFIFATGFESLNNLMLNKNGLITERKIINDQTHTFYSVS